MFDYIIVGGGSAGCVLANRLSKNPNNKVCLLEAGPPDRHPLIRMPLGIMWMMRSNRMNWQYYTEPQTHLNNRRLFWPRGKTLGGSSSSNAMIYTRGHASDYDEWEALGNKGWSYSDLLPLFKRSQHQERGPSEYHGTGGPLNVADGRSRNQMSEVFIKASEQAGHPISDDFNSVEQEGVGHYQLTQKNGRRFSVSHAYLHPAKARSNLTIITKAQATKINFDGKRAASVTYIQQGITHTIEAANEVILSGGAINSPQLLMCSGVGPKEELTKHGISVVHELPGVGQNLQDHLDVLIVQKSTKWASINLGLMAILRSPRDLFNYFFRGRGTFTTNGAEAGGFVKTSPELDKPDIQFHYTPALLDDHAKNLMIMISHGYSLHVCNLRPKSRGRIGLKSADPLAPALMQPNYLEHPEDMDVMVKGVKAARKILAAEAYDNYRGKEIFPGEHIQSDEEIKEFIREKAGTIYHPVSTCKMGHDDMAVVDDTLKVHGMEGLRVVDASIMPTLIGGNTNAPTVVIAEKAAEMILENRLTSIEGNKAYDETKNITTMNSFENNEKIAVMSTSYNK